jgi:hypothetical protein
VFARAEAAVALLQALTMPRDVTSGGDVRCRRAAAAYQRRFEAIYRARGILERRLKGRTLDTLGRLLLADLTDVNLDPERHQRALATARAERGRLAQQLRYAEESAERADRVIAEMLRDDYPDDGAIPGSASPLGAAAEELHWEAVGRLRRRVGFAEERVRELLGVSPQEAGDRSESEPPLDLARASALLAQVADWSRPAEGDEAATTLLDADPRYLIHPGVSLIVACWHAALVRSTPLSPRSERLDADRVRELARRRLEGLIRSIARASRRAGPPRPNPARFRMEVEAAEDRIERGLQLVRQRSKSADREHSGTVWLSDQKIAERTGLTVDSVLALTTKSRPAVRGALIIELQAIYGVSRSGTIRSWLKKFGASPRE